MSPNEQPPGPHEVCKCVECGCELAPDLPRGLCSRCALVGALNVGAEGAGSEFGVLTSPGQFGDFELIEEIARGGMGVVYKARQKSLDRLVAVKMLLFGGQADAKSIRRFKIEAVAAGALHHPNIVAIQEVGIHHGQHFIVMDFVNGPNLARLVKEQPLPARRAAQYVTTIAGAIHYAHERGILHRDLKPSNVLIDSNDQPRVTDFGLAKQLDGDSQLASDLTQLTVTGHLLGSPGYMPPELINGARGAIDLRSDVYSLGATFYHLLTGRPPFGGGSVAETLQQVQHQEPVAPRLLNPGIPLDLETICLKCLEKEPRRRYSSAGALGDDLQRWLANEPIQARRIGPASRLGRWARRNPVSAVLIGSLCIALGASLTLLQMLRAQKRSAEEAQARTERARSVVLELIGVSGFWDKDRPSLQVPSHVLALASGAAKGMAESRSIEKHTLGLLVEEDPAATVIGYAVLLAAVEKSINKDRTNALRFELTLFKKNKDAIDALLNHQVDLLKIGGISYLKAKARDPDIRLLVSQNPPKQGVVFVRADSDIKSVQDLANRSVAFGDRFSTISAWAFCHLVQAGITNLKRIDFLDSISVFESDPSLRLQPGNLSSHLLTIHAVQTNGYDAGVSSESTFLRSGAPQGLRALLFFPSDPVWWVAGSGFPPELGAELSRALVSLRDPKLFQAISRRITHYLPAKEEEVKRLRQAMVVAAKYFGGEDAQHE